MRRASKSTFYKSIAWVAGGTAAAQAITILTTPIVTRMYTPSDYGMFAVFRAILGVMQPLCTLTYAIAIPLAEDDDLAHNVLKICFTITLTLSLALGIVVLASGRFIATQFGVPQVAPYLWLLSVCLFGAGCYEALSSWAIRKKRFRIISATQFMQGASSAGTKIGLGWLGIRPLGLLLGLLASRAAGCISIFRILLREEPQALRHFSWSEIRDAAKRFRAFPLFRSWSRILLGINVGLPVFFIAAMFDPIVVGLFGLAHGMVNLPMSLIGRSVSRVFYAEIARFGKSRPVRIQDLSLSVMKKMFLVGIIVSAVIVIAGPRLFSVVFGAEWHEAGVYACWLSIPIMFRFVSSPVMRCLDVLEMQGVQLLVNIARNVVIVVAFGVSKVLDLSAIAAISLYAVNLSVFYILLIITILLLLERQVRLMERHS